MSTDPVVRRRELGIYLEMSSQRKALSKTSSQRFSVVVSNLRLLDKLTAGDYHLFLATSCDLSP